MWRYFLQCRSLSRCILNRCSLQGIGYTGPTTCSLGKTCVYLNEYYSQCQLDPGE
ncbi:hypothetical protein CPC08DRAFT_652070 [Agrocybe pediades]|nr:hypothetical protein CPC08DRAFT_652070 [Agrocybe pediades]